MKLIYLLFGLFSLWVPAQENYIQINGSTNVNKFQCVDNRFKAETGVYTISEKSLPNIILKVNDFDCGNKMMTKDFQKTLVAEKYPNMIIRFLSIVKNRDGFNAVVEVKMMNQSKKYNIEFETENNKIIGRKNVKFSDFNITPPKRMGGMIVVKDDLNLVFSLATKI